MTHLSRGFSLTAQRPSRAPGPSPMSGVPFCLISMSMSVWLSAMKRLLTVMTCTQHCQQHHPGSGYIHKEIYAMVYQV